MRLSRQARQLAVVLGLVLATSPARAGDADAEELFRKGVTLLGRGEVKEACRVLGESQRREPAAGTLLNLAACYERDGRLSLAFDAFRDAREAAISRDRADWVRIATEHLDGLAARVGFVTIDTSDVGEVTALELSLDGHLLTKDQMEQLRRGPLAVDPGAHTLQVTAPDRLPATYSFVAPPAATLHLAPLAASPDRAPPPREEPTASSWRKPTGLVVGAIGVGGLAFAGVAILVATSALDDAKAACPSYPDHCTADAESPNRSARSWSAAATVGVIGGTALTAIGVALFAWPSDTTSKARVALAGDGRVLMVVPW